MLCWSTMCPVSSTTRCARNAAWLTAAAAIALTAGCDIFGALQGGEGLPCTTSAACPNGASCVDGTCDRLDSGSARADGASDAHDVDRNQLDGASVDGARGDHAATDSAGGDRRASDAGARDVLDREGGASDHGVDAATGTDASANDGAASDATGLDTAPHDSAPHDSAPPDGSCSVFQCRLGTGECVTGTQDRACGQLGNPCEDCSQRNNLCATFTCAFYQCTPSVVGDDSTPCGIELECWAGECSACVNSHNQVCAYWCEPQCSMFAPALVDCLGRCEPTCACTGVCAGAC